MRAGRPLYWQLMIEPDDIANLVAYLQAAVFTTMVCSFASTRRHAYDRPTGWFCLAFSRGINLAVVSAPSRPGQRPGLVSQMQRQPSMRQSGRPQQRRLEKRQ